MDARRPRYATDARCIRDRERRPRVAIGFYGLVRNMTLVLPSIERHVFDVLDRASISYDVFVHSMFLRRVSNLRSGEKDVPLDPYDFIRLRPCVFEVKHQGVALEQSNLSTSGTDGQALRIQPWGDGLASIHNLLIALESQHALARLIARHARDLNVTYDAVAALRPDVAYVRDIDLPEALPTLMASASTPTVYTPDFGYGVMANGTFVRPYAQQSCCLSDRLAFGHVAPMLNVYMTRGDGWIRDARGRLSKGQAVLDGERYLKLTLSRARISTKNSIMRVLRVRANGEVQKKDTRWNADMNMDEAEMSRCVNNRTRRLIPETC